LEVEQRKTADAQKEAAEAQLALKTYVEKVARRQRARGLNVKKLIELLDGKPKLRVELLYNPNDSEAWSLARQIHTWVGEGSSSQKGAGWSVSPPMPIPPEARYNDIPPAMRFGGAYTTFGLTFRAKDISKGADLSTALGALMEAINRSVTPEERALTGVFEGDSSLPDNPIVVVVGPKLPVWWPDNDLEPKVNRQITKRTRLVLKSRLGHHQKSVPVDNRSAEG
jgi:hypothetical protein